MLAVHRLRLVLVARGVDDVVPPDVAALVPVDVPLRTAHHEHLLDGRLAGDGGVDGRLERAGLPRRNWPSLVMTTLASASAMRALRASEENPPKTTECGAPMRAQASIEIAASGIIGR